MEHGRIHLSGMPRNVTSMCLREEMWKRYGSVLDAYVPVNRTGGGQEGKGYGFVVFRDPSVAESLLERGTVEAWGAEVRISRANAKRELTPLRVDAREADDAGRRSQGLLELQVRSDSGVVCMSAVNTACECMPLFADVEPTSVLLLNGSRSIRVDAEAHSALGERGATRGDRPVGRCPADE